MAKSNGSSHKLYFIESSTNKAVVSLNNLKLSGSGNKIDFTTKDNNGFEDFEMGLLSYTLDFDGKVDFQPGTNNRNVNDVVTAFKNRSTVTVLIKNTTTGDTTYQGSAKVLSFDITSGTETALEFSASLGIIGDITVGTVA